MVKKSSYLEKEVNKEKNKIVINLFDIFKNNLNERGNF